jgi:hypothetical protein
MQQGPNTIAFPKKLLPTDAINIAKQQAASQKKRIWVYETLSETKIFESEQDNIEAKRVHVIWPSGKIDTRNYLS